MKMLLIHYQPNVEEIAVKINYLIMATAIFLGIGMYQNNIASGYEIIGKTIHSNIIQNTIVNTIEKEQDTNALFSYEEEKIRWENNYMKKYANGIITKLDNGIIHVKMKKTLYGQPIKINLVEINRKLNPNIDISPVLVSDCIHQKANIKKLAEKNNAIVAINGTYFKQDTGTPLGTLSIDNKILTGPIYDRVALGIGEYGYKIARIKFEGSIENDVTSVKIDNINQPRMLSSYVLVYTSDWGKYSPKTPQNGIQIAIENNKIIQVSNLPLQIPVNGYVISGPKEKLQQVISLKEVKVNIGLDPQWTDVKHIISGGPYLIKNNNLFVDFEAEKLKGIMGKNPRTAVGYTENDEFIMITIDGRENESVGINLYDLAKLMKSFGCSNAINLDGGSSTAMYVNGTVHTGSNLKNGVLISNALTVSISDKISYSESEN